MNSNDFENIKIFNNFIDQDDASFLMNWINENAEDKNRFRHRTGVAKNRGLAVRAVFPDEKPPYLFKELELIINKYSSKLIDLIKDEYKTKENLYFYGVSLTRLSKDIQLRIHKDVHNDFSTLTWSCVVYLNDDYENGEVAFVKELDKEKFPSSPWEKDFYLYYDEADGYVYKPKALDAIVFPADQFHGGREITNGTKYAMILWLVKEEQYQFEGFDSDRVMNLLIPHLKNKND